MRSVTAISCMLLLSVASFAQTHTNVTIEDAQTITGGKLFLQTPGVFNPAQWNNFVVSQYGTETAQTIFSGSGAPIVGYNVDSLEGIITVPVGATTTTMNGVAGYCANYSSASAGGCVGGYFLGNAQVAGSHAWGVNPIATDIPVALGGGAATIYGNETDIGIYNSGTVGAGLLLNGTFKAQSSNFPAISIVKPNGSGSTAEWQIGISLQDGATSSAHAFDIGAQTTGNSQPSQVINFFGINSGGTHKVAMINGSANGDVILTPTSGKGVQIVGALDQGASGNYAGACTMSTTTCSVTLSQSYTSSPLCFVSPQNAGAAATYISGGAYCVVSGGSATVTAAASNVGTWGVLVVGNPN